MFLEAQFGEDAITPIAQPKLPTLNGSAEDSDEVENEKAEAAELARLHALGIPVPGVEIKVDNRIVKVWLEDLEVECSNKTLGDRVRAVVERAVETIAPLWQ
jgi:cleavage and polyadenylation specificity factor subunit 3